MQAKWITPAEVAVDRHLTLAEAQQLVDGINCPKADKISGTVDLF